MPVKTPEDAQRLLPWQYNRGHLPVSPSQGSSGAFSQQQSQPVTETGFAFTSEPQEATNPFGLGTNSMIYAAGIHLNGTPCKTPLHPSSGVNADAALRCAQLRDGTGG